MSSGDELARYSRIQRIFETLESQGIDGQQVIKDILTVDPAEILKNKRAMDLMKDWLSEKEMKDFVATGEIAIPSRLYEGRVYKISRGRHDLTHVWENGEHTQDLCVHASNNRELPYGDSILTKIITLKSDEAFYIANSNARMVRRGDAAGDRAGGLADVIGLAEAALGMFAFATSGGQNNVFAHTVQQQRPVPPPQPMPTGTYSQARAMLVAQKNAVRMDMVGVVSTPPLPNSMDKNLVDNTLRYLIAQAKIDNISHTEEGMVVRGIIPELDLRAIGEFQQDVNCRPTWRQPQDSVYQVNNEEVNVYRINLNCENDRKCYVLYGFMNLMPSEFNPVSYIKIMRGHVKVIDMIDVSHINLVDCIQFKTPFLFKRNDDVRIIFGLNDDARGKFSRIKILGAVAEAVGNNIVG